MGRMLEVAQREEGRGGGAGVDLQVAGVAQEGSSVLYSTVRHLIHYYITLRKMGSY